MKKPRVSKYEAMDGRDATRLAAMDEILARAQQLALELEGGGVANISRNGVLRFLLGQAAVIVQTAHASAHFGATGRLLDPPVEDHAFVGAANCCGHPCDHANEDGEPTEQTTEVCGRTKEEHTR